MIHVLAQCVAVCCSVLQCDAMCCSVPWFTCMCAMTHARMWHASCLCVWGLPNYSSLLLPWLIHMWHDSFTRVAWLIHMCDMTHPYVWHDSFICVTWTFRYVTRPIHMCDMTYSYVWHGYLIRVTWLMCFATHQYVCGMSIIYWLINVSIIWVLYEYYILTQHIDSSICVRHEYQLSTCIRTCDMTHPHVWRDSSTRVTWLIHTCDVTHPHVWRDSFICVARLIHTSGVTWLIHRCLCLYPDSSICAWHASCKRVFFASHYYVSSSIATHCNTLQHTATHCNTLQHTTTHCKRAYFAMHQLNSIATHCNSLQPTATHCNTLQHTANVRTSPYTI